MGQFEDVTKRLDAIQEEQKVAKTERAAQTKTLDGMGKSFTSLMEMAKGLAGGGGEGGGSPLKSIGDFFLGEKPGS